LFSFFLAIACPAPVGKNPKVKNIKTKQVPKAKKPKNKANN